MLSIRPKINTNKDQINDINDEEKNLITPDVNRGPCPNKKEYIKEIHNKIISGSNSFLWKEYLYLSIFLFFFSVLIYFFVENKRGQFYFTLAFIVGSFTSILCSYLGMMMATSTNLRTIYKAK